jgi:hypothetical protein
MAPADAQRRVATKSISCAWPLRHSEALVHGSPSCLASQHPPVRNVTDVIGVEIAANGGFEIDGD